MPKNFPFHSPRKAFTLVEILVVIGIITILSALVITALNPVQLRRSARDTDRKKDISVISAALEQYYADNNVYPTAATFTCLTDRILSGVDTDAAPCADPKVAGTVYLKAGAKTQSTTAVEYCYSNPTNTQNYMLCAPLEGDTTITRIGGNNASGVTGTCTVGIPTGFAATAVVGTDIGLYCIENPF